MRLFKCFDLELLLWLGGGGFFFPAYRNAYKIKKYDAYVRKGDPKKVIFVYYFEFDTIFFITGAEGK